MTREEAINAITQFIENYAYGNDLIGLKMAIETLKKERPHGEWVKRFDGNEWYWYCTSCKTQWYEEDLYMGGNEFPDFCPNCGADMSANDKQVTGKLDSEYKAKVKELEDAIAKCEQAEKDFKSRTCKFRSPINCDFCAFHSECEEHWKEGDEE